MKKDNVLKRLFPYMGKRKYLIPLSLLLGAISSILSAIPFVLIWLLVRDILKDPNSFKFYYVKDYIIWIGICAVLSILVYFIAVMAAHLAAFRVEVGMQKKAMENLLNKPLGFFDSVESGKLRKAINEGASTTHQFLAHQLVDLSGTTFSLLFIFISMFVIDWRMGLVSMIPLILSMILMMSMMGDLSGEYMTAYTQAMDEMSNEAIEYVRGIPVVKTFGGSVFSFKKFYNSIIKYQEFAIKYTLMWKNKYSLCIIILNAATVFLVPLIILQSLGNGDIKVILSNYIFYLIILPNFIMIIMRSAMFNKSSQVAELALDRIESTLDFDDMIFPENSKDLEDYSVEFKNVSFAYPGAESNAIDGISFKISQGERVALVGASGSGKTTIARLATRFWDIESGEIMIGGQNIKDISKENLMKNISFVFQNTKLFSKSLRENISMGNKNIKDRDIERAIDLSMSREIIDDLDKGLDTVIGTEGRYLSGGEQQRISLARAIVKDAPIVILDEATAYADPENESKLHDALRELSKDKTTLMIVHRLSSVKDVDRIIVISDGKIIEEGSHEELINHDGAYADMFREYESSISWQLKAENANGGE
ncbi:MAG: ABC transporter ATP-binding protein [Tissierellia bacterium]|nr:ABC transporter ATP-binding protein [Tissierellia bacterium]